MQIIRHTTTAIFILSIYSCAPERQEANLKQLFENHKGTLVIYDEHLDEYLIHNQKRSHKRFSPFSTFKIANSLCTLDAGSIENPDIFMQWDRRKYPAASWWPSQWQGRHNMRTAIKYSVVPFYRELASRLGAKKMQACVHKINYGNADISSGVDNFWLNGSIKISAREQIDFLRKFYHNDSGFRPETIAQVKKILVLESHPDYILSGKTGAGSGYLPEHPRRAIGWFVGYVQANNRVSFFALNIDGADYQSVLKPRITILKAALQELNIIPAP